MPNDEQISIENPLFGRIEITTPVDEITQSNVVDVLNKALAIHNVNAFYQPTADTHLVPLAASSISNTVIMA
jgi:hypothetical protein